MGIRADRRERRKAELEATQKSLPNGKTHLPPDLIYKHCIKH